MMRRTSFTVLWALPALMAVFTPVRADETMAMKLIIDMGGKIDVDHDQPDQPVVSVNLAGGNVTNADLKMLKPFKRLRSLALNATVSKSPPRANGRITDAGLKELKDLKNLQFLDLAGQTQITDAGLKELNALEKLQSLVLSHNNITDAGMKELQGLKKLRLLNLKFTGVTDAGLDELRELKSLKTLVLANNKTTSAGIDRLKAALPEIEIFDESYGK